MQYQTKVLAAVAAVLVTGGFAAVWFGLTGPVMAPPTPQPTPVATRIFASDPFGDRVVAVDLAGRLLGSVATGRLPHGLAATRDGKRVLVAEAGSQSLAEIDTLTYKVVAQRIVGRAPAVPGHRGKEKAIAAASSCKACHGARIVGAYPASVSLSADETQAWVPLLRAGSIGKVGRGPKPGAPVPDVPFDVATDRAPSTILVHPKTGEVYVIGRAYSEHPSPHAAEPTDGNGWQVSTDPEHVTGPGSSTIAVFAPGLGPRRATFSFPLGGAYGAAFSADGKELFVACRGADRVAVLGTHPLAIRRTLDVGPAPVSVLVLDGKSLLVTCFGSRPGEVRVVDPVGGKTLASLAVPPNPALATRDEATGLVYVACAGDDHLVELDPRARKVLRTIKLGFYPADVRVVHPL